MTNQKVSRWLLPFLFAIPLLAISQNKQLAAAEYFWDIDPGVGNGIALPVLDGSYDEAIEAIFENTSALPAEGVHTLNIRLQEINASWSAAYSTLVLIDESTTEQRSIQITLAEYYWDNDPGEGSGTPLIVFDGAFDEAMESAFENTNAFPSEGNHTLNIRMRDAENVWSGLFSTIIFIDEPTTDQRNIQITYAEYFWDTDPGEGSGTPLLVLDGNFDEAIETVFATTTALPSEGNHVFKVRMRDAENVWSSLFSTIINIDEATTAQREIKITSAEMFWDNDPGQGNGIGLVAFDADFDEAIEQALKCTTALPAEGPHKLCIRMRDAEFQWSPVFCTVIVIDESTTALRNIQITQAEYFWDADPGEGSAIPLIVIDGNFNEAIEFVSATASMSLSEGPHVLNIRMKDAEGAWSNEFRAVVLVDEQTEEQRNIYVAAAEYWFDADSGAGSGTPIVSLDGSFNEAIEAIVGGAIPSPVISGVHTLWFRAKDPQGGWGSTFGIVVNMDIDVVTFTTAINGASNICAGIDQIGQPYHAQAATSSTYAWSIVGGIIVSGQGTPHIVVNWNSGSNQSLTLQQCLGELCQEDVLSVAFSQPTSTTSYVNICEGESYFVGGGFKTESGTYMDELQSALGCDSIVTTILTVLPHSLSNMYASICVGESLFVGGANQTQAGTYLNTYASANGCDSLVYTHLTVHPSYNMNIIVEICPGQSYFVGGANQTTSGFYSDLYQSIYGCDSLVVTQLIVNSTIHTFYNIEICGGESYFAGGANQTTSGTYLDFLPGVCTEIRTTYLLVNPSYNINNAVEIYNGQSYYAGGAEQNTSGVYVDAYETILGCDSIVSTTLTVIDVVNHIQYIDICEGETFYAGGAIQNQSGTYVDVITGACTETLTTILTVHPNYNEVNQVVICLGQSYFAGGAEQTTSGVYYDEYQTPFGCDSLITTNLTVVNSIDSEQTVQLCEGDSAFLAGAWQTTSGVYMDVTNVAQCVEVLTTTLIVFPHDAVTNNVTICTGQSYYAQGALQTSSGTYVDELQTIFGCDSVVTTQLTVTPVIENYVAASICFGDSIFLAGAFQHEAGIYVDQLQTVAGCDSVVTTTLSVISNVAGATPVNNGDGTVTCPSLADSYIWTIDGLGCDIIAVETITPTITLLDYCESEAYVVSVARAEENCQSETSEEITIILADCSQSNDNCSGATALTIDGLAVTDSNQCATNFAESAGSCSNDIGRSTWYKFVAQTGVDYLITLSNIIPISSEFNPKLELFYGTCNGLNPLACINIYGNSTGETLEVEELIAGTYLIRISGELIQAGAYNIKVENSGTCAGDFDGNGLVNVNDLLIFSAQFGCTSNCTVDLDGNNIINVIDLLIISSLFGTYCP